MTSDPLKLSKMETTISHKAAYLCVCVLLQETTSDLERAGGSHPGYKGGHWAGWGCQHLPGITDFANAPKMGEIGQN